MDSKALREFAERAKRLDVPPLAESMDAVPVPRQFRVINSEQSRVLYSEPWTPAAY